MPRSDVTSGADNSQGGLLGFLSHCSEITPRYSGVPKIHSNNRLPVALEEHP